MKRYSACAWLVALVLALAACTNDEQASTGVPEGMIQVNFEVSGNYGAPFSDLKTRANDAASLDEKHTIPTDPGTDNKYQPGPIADGTTLWIAVYKTENENTTPDNAVLDQVKSYRVSGSSLIPCKVDEDGNVLKNDDNDMYDTPLYLPEGTYYFRALGPARELVTNSDGVKTSLSIDNGQWVIAHDDRYEETAGDTKVTLTSSAPDALVKLNPLINQTARLKFTIYSAENDPFVHTLQMQPIGVEVSGLQKYYNKGDENNAWNWTLCGDTLIAYPGNKNTVIYLKEPLESDNDHMVIETPILPTDAVSTPLIVLFNMEVNGNPTQFEMMLNRKIFRAAYSYHYRGKVTIDDGVAAIDWESVSWSADVPLFPKETTTE